MSDEEEIGADEQQEAEALARALDRGSAEAGLPEDALQTAALLRYQRDGGALSPDRSEAILGDVLSVADRIADRAAARPEPRRDWRWLLGAVGLAAALLLFVWLRPGGEAAPTALPSPDLGLLRAQMARASGGEDADDAFEAEMDNYRGAVYASLEERYGAR